MLIKGVLITGGFKSLQEYSDLPNLEQGLQENSDAQNSNALILIKEI